MSVPRIVIVGAGFGGVYAARRLAPYARAGKITLTIIDKSNYFLFTPLLHEVATGGLSPLSVMEPLREIFAGDRVRVVRGTVESVDTDTRTIHASAFASSGAQGAPLAIPYDTLVISTGAGTAYRGVPGADTHAYPLKTAADALRIRERIINAFDEAGNATDDAVRERLLSFAVIGGGATGTELVAELQEFAQGIVERYHRCVSHGILRPRVSLIHAGAELLPQFPEPLRSSAVAHLRRLGIDVRLGAIVREVTAEGIAFTDGTSLAAGTVLWTAGVSAQAPEFRGALQPSFEQGRLAVDPSLSCPGVDGVYALGDVAHAVDSKGAPYPLLAQVAVAQAATVVANVIADLEGRPRRTFVFRSKGSLVSLGQWFAVGEIFSTHLRGRFAWWVWRTVYLFKFLSWRKRIRIAFEWTIGIFYPRDIGSVR